MLPIANSPVTHTNKGSPLGIAPAVAGEREGSPFGRAPAVAGERADSRLTLSDGRAATSPEGRGFPLSDGRAATSPEGRGFLILYNEELTFVGRKR